MFSLQFSLGKCDLLSYSLSPYAQSLSCFQLFTNPWTVAHHASQSMEFSGQEYCSGLPFTPPGDLSHVGMAPTSLVSPALQADSLPLCHPSR